MNIGCAESQLNKKIEKSDKESYHENVTEKFDEPNRNFWYIFILQDCTTFVLGINNSENH